MSRSLFVFSIEPISVDQFIGSLERVGANYRGLDKHANEHRGQFAFEDYGDSINIYLANDPIEDVDEEQDKDILLKLGGKPKGGIGLEPLGTAGGRTGELEINYLATLADKISFIVTDFDGMCMTGEEVQEKKKLGWKTLTPAAPGREFG